MNAGEGDSARLRAEVGAAYDSSAQDWAEGPVRMYGPLATALAEAAAQVAPAMRAVLDIGSGTGVAGRAALAAGAHRVVSADLALGMLRRCGAELHPLAADAARLPFRDGSFDLVLAAFSLSHLPDLAAGLTEIRRIGRSLGASAFSPDWTHPAKDAVDDALVSFGYRPPAWHTWLKIHGESSAGDPAPSDGPGSCGRLHRRGRADHYRCHRASRSGGARLLAARHGAGGPVRAGIEAVGPC